MGGSLPIGAYAKVLYIYIYFQSHSYSENSVKIKRLNFNKQFWAKAESYIFIYLKKLNSKIYSAFSFNFG